MIVAFSGGVGGAKLAWGLDRVLPAGTLKVVVNTGDDFEHLGLHVSPDIDTVVYTLAGLANAGTGWGMAGETWQFMAAVAQLGGPDWFKLGDRDLAMHVMRSARLRRGDSLATVTADVCRQLGIRSEVRPMSNDAVRTVVDTDEGRLGFQDYFVRRRCEPRVAALTYEGAAKAQAEPGVLAWLADPALQAIVFCPSNPYLSIDPMLAVSALKQGLQAATAPKIAVSPIIAGAAVKGPAAKLLAELGSEVSALGVARHYQELVDALLVDEADAALAPAIEALGLRAIVAPILMKDEDGRRRVATAVLEAARSFACAS